MHFHSNSSLGLDSPGKDCLRRRDRHVLARLTTAKMAPSMLITVVLVILMAKRLVDIYAGGHYVCPSCGPRSARRHSADCPWGRPPSR
jgi:hypothetical protein